MLHVDLLKSCNVYIAEFVCSTSMHGILLSVQLTDVPLHRLYLYSFDVGSR